MQYYYNKISVSNTSFPTQADAIITFNTQALSLLNEGLGIIEYSFDGTNLHGQLNSSLPNRGMFFDALAVSSIWFRLGTGTAGPVDVSIIAWIKYAGG